MSTGGSQSLKELVCVSVDAYAHTLTRGRHYEVLREDEEKQQVYIKGDNGRQRWYPMYCFAETDAHVPVLLGFRLDDPIEFPDEQLIDVIIQLSDGQVRYCSFTTPAALYGSGDFDEESGLSFHYNIPHVIVVDELSEAAIWNILQHIDSQGELLECTLPLIPKSH